MDPNTDRVVTENQDSLFVTREESGVIWLAVTESATGRVVEITLTEDDATQLRDALKD